MKNKNLSKCFQFNYFYRSLFLKRNSFKSFCDKNIKNLHVDEIETTKDSVKPNFIQTEQNEDQINNENTNFNNKNDSDKTSLINKESIQFIKQQEHIPKDIMKNQLNNSGISLNQFGQNKFITFLYENNLNYKEQMKSRGDNTFLNATIKMVHYLDDRNINDYKKGIAENNYEFYDLYKDVPEFLILGRSNVGKSSLINKLFEHDIALQNKKPGKTQRLEFYLFGREGKAKMKFGKSIYSKLKLERIAPTGIIIDAPGFGYVDGPVILRRKFKYLIYTYLNYAVRLKQIIYLINGEYGITPIDKDELQFLNNFNKEIQIVFTKVDKFNDKAIIQHLEETSHFIRDLKNVRTEILMTSSVTGYGIRNLRTHLYMDIQEIKDIKILKEIESITKEDLLKLFSERGGNIKDYEKDFKFIDNNEVDSDSDSKDKDKNNNLLK